MFRFVKTAIVTIIVLFTAGTVQSQIDNVDALLRGGVEDANLLLEAYLTPFGNGFGADLNSSWATSARTHGFLGFDLTVSGNAAIAPEEDETFDVSALVLQNFRLAPGQTSRTPTVIGDEQDGPLLDIVLANPVTGQDEVIEQIRLPRGVGFNYVPSPMIQASVGIFGNTDVTVRYFPEVNISDDLGSVRMAGFGVKHELNQWIAVPLPVDLAVAAGITKFQAEADLQIEPTDPDLPRSGASYNNQEIDLEAASFTASILVSKKIALFTLFGGLGIESSTVDVKLEGTFPVTVIETDPADPNFGQQVIRDLEDPVSLSFDGSNSVRASAGVQLELPLLRLYLAYALADYPVASAGIGFTFR